MSVKITEVRNAISLNDSNTEFEVEINHPTYGWIPYHLLSDDTDTTINDDEIIKLIGTNFRKYTDEEQNDLDAGEIRMERDTRLEDVDDIYGTLRWEYLSSEKQNEWKQYRIDLLNVPQQSGFPSKVTWPTKPE
tara:strand:+ start:48 stop:449 length:402 start_codon:yes stop_codon:yes gene_type:complete